MTIILKRLLNTNLNSHLSLCEWLGGMLGFVHGFNTGNVIFLCLSL